MDVSLVILMTLTVAILSWRVVRIGQREPGIPPGPPTIPLLGNLLHIPTTWTPLKLTEWAQQYGGIYSLKIGPKTTIVLSTAESVHELIDVRSGISADRPPLHLADIIYRGLHFGLARYGDTWKTLRKAAQAVLTKQAAEKHLPIQQAEGMQLLYDLLHKPNKWDQHIMRYSNSVMLSVLFGRRSPRFDTKQTRDFFQMARLVSMVLVPGGAPAVDLLPILKFVPERWAKWKRDCKTIRRMQQKMYNELLEDCERRMTGGFENGCYMEDVLKESGMTKEMMLYLGGTLIEGGSETTSSFLQSMILSLVAFPDSLRKAQEEMDRVVGDRLPVPSDWDQLPYVQALVKETHRFRPVVPLAIPHMTTEAQEYQGYIIPEGTQILINTWGIFHDPKVFEDPEKFWPDRFLSTEHGTKPGADTHFRSTIGFGGGRRICPGIHIANNSLMLTTMMLVWAFDFSAGFNKDGSRVPANIWDYPPGMTLAPRPFICRIQARSSAKAELIEQQFAACTERFIPFECGLEGQEQEYLKGIRCKPPFVN